MSSAIPADVEVSSPDRDQPSPVLRWGPIALFCLLLVALARHAAAGISDPDTLWHILAGDHLWQSHQLAGPDPLSRFTVEPWVLNQWLPELGMALVNHLGGLAAVAWAGHVLRITMCVVVFLACRSVAGPLAASVAAGAAVLGTADSLSPRPQLIGFVLLATVVLAWLRTAQDRRARWWLVGVMWLWACCHGTWVSGVSVGGAVVVGLALDGHVPRRQLAHLAGLVAAGAAVTAVTPLGPRLFESFATVRAVSPYVAEWRLPAPGSPSVLVTLGLAALVPALWAVSRRRPTWTHLALWLVGVLWASSAMRTVAIGAIILAPLAALGIDGVTGRRRLPPDRAESLTVLAGAGLSIVLAALLAAVGPSSPQKVPVGLDPSLSALTPGTVVWNSDTLGGWLMWSHPDLHHTRDTRAELYGPAGARDYLTVINGSPGWQGPFDATRPAAALVEDGSGLARVLQQQGWSVSGRDAGYVLLRPSGSSTATGTG